MKVIGYVLTLVRNWFSRAPKYGWFGIIVCAATAADANRVSLGAADEADTKPNIVLIVADDLGWGDVGWHGSEIKTPNLDKLADSGAKLEAFYVQPVCTPTRAALLTGRYPIRHGLQTGVVRPWAEYGLPLEEQTLAQGLKTVGYATAIVGKWHLGHSAPAYLPTRRGFDHQYGHYNGAIDYNTHVRDGGFDWHRDDKASRDQGYSTKLIAKESVRIVDTYAGKKPFFLYVPFNAVHAPHQVPEKYLKDFDHLKGERRIYAGMLTALDESVGEIVDAIDKAGERKNTLFIFTSDNGGPQPGVVTSNGKLRDGKATHYEGGVRVAAFASWEGHIPAGSSVVEPLHVSDWYPTLLGIVGAKVDQKLPLDGKDAWATISQGKASPHEDILINATPYAGAIRSGDWKLVQAGKRATAGFDGELVAESADSKSVELFDLRQDPYEEKDLSKLYPEKVAELTQKLEAYRKQAVAPKAAPKPKNFKTPAVWGESKGSNQVSLNVPELNVGDSVPAFATVDDTGSIWKSVDHVGKKIVVVYFYPADLTGGCTKQACSFRDDSDKLSDLGVEVVGVSGDSVANHQLFKKAHRLNFTLLADTEGQVAELFGVPVTREPKTIKVAVDGKEESLSRNLSTKRWTFIIGTDGKLLAKNTSVVAADDSRAVIEAIKAAKQSSKSEPARDAK